MFSIKMFFCEIHQHRIKFGAQMWVLGKFGRGRRMITFIDDNFWGNILAGRQKG